MRSYGNIYSGLLELIKEYAKTTDRLPPEDQLAAQLGISRVKLRDVLAQLQSNGYITRKKGVGTLINKYILAETARLDIDVFFEDLIAESGHRPYTLIQKIKSLPQMPDEIRESLELRDSESVYQIEKTISSDEVPVIFVTDYVPSKYYNQKDIDIRMLANSTFCFVENYCDELLDNLIVRINACSASAKEAAHLQLPEGAPILKLCSVCYSQKLRPIMYSIECYNTSLLPFSFQKKIIRSKTMRQALGADDTDT